MGFTVTGTYEVDLATLDELDAVDAGKIDKGELVINVLDEGAVGDGVTDNASAIHAAMTKANEAASGGPAVVWFPYTTAGYGSGPLAPKSNVTLRGENRVALIKVGTPTAQWINASAATNVVIEGLTIDANGLVTSAAMRAANGTTHMTVRDCKFQSSAALGTSVHAFDTQASTTSDIIVEDCWFSDLPDSIRVNQGPARVTIRRNLFTGWSERCIYVLGNSTNAVTDLTIEDNVCRDMAFGGSVRQAITAQGQDSALHKRVRVRNNIVIGPGTSYTAATNAGSADQISLHRCEDFQVIGNISVGGGDVGITIAMQCRRGVVANNICEDNDTAGIALGSGTTTSLPDVTVTGNSLMNNGQNREADRPANARVGIYLFGASNVAISGNRTGDDQGTKTQQSAYYLRDVTSARFAGNNDMGNAVGTYDLGTGNADITEASMTAVT